MYVDTKIAVLIAIVICDLSDVWLKTLYLKINNRYTVGDDFNQSLEQVAFRDTATLCVYGCVTPRTVDIVQ